MNLMIKTVGLVLLSTSLSANSQEQPANTEPENTETEDRSKLQWLVGAGITVGGDDLLKVQFTGKSSETLEAGGLIDLKAGILYDVAESPMSFQSTLGYHFDSVEATNGDASFSRFPLDFLAFYNAEKHRIGAGGTYHFATEFDVDLPGLKGKADMKDTLGLVLEYGYKFQDNLIVGLRYVDIDYKVDGGTGAKIDGGHGGLYGYITF